MKEQRDYTQDLAEIRTMMERSSKFLSLSGLAGVMAGIYALVGAWIAFTQLGYTNQGLATGSVYQNSGNLFLTALLVLVLSIGTATFLSHRKANRRGESVWNAASKRLLSGMLIPLITGGAVVLLLASNYLIELAAPMTLIFYGLALYNAGSVTYEDVRSLGIIQIGLGLFGTLYTGYGLLFWAIGFGLLHIIYGIYIYIRYER